MWSNPKKRLARAFLLTCLLFIANLLISQEQITLDETQPEFAELASLARDFLPGHTKAQVGIGLDCSGYVCNVYGHFGIKLPRTSQQQYRYCTPIPREELQPGDLVFFITRGKQISHVGLCMSDSSFIHSPGKGKMVREELLSGSYYSKRFYSGGRIMFTPPKDTETSISN